MGYAKHSVLIDKILVFFTVNNDCKFDPFLSYYDSTNLLFCLFTNLY